MALILWKIIISVLLVGQYLCHAENLSRHSRTLYPDKGHYASTNSKNISEIRTHDLENAIYVAEDQIEKLATFEKNIQVSGVKTEKLSPCYGQMVDFLPSDDAINKTKSAFVIIKASQYLASKYCVRFPKAKECTEQISDLKLTGTSMGSICLDTYQNIKCDREAKYRSADGSCNNLKMPAWGKSNTAYRRILKSNYDDGLYTLRSTSVNGKELPSARLISTSITESRRAIDQTKTQALAAWGLFIGNDVAHTPASNMVNLKIPITCCTNDGRPLSPRHNHISCAPIVIPRTDVFYNKFFQTCMNYVRSLPAMRPDCTFGPTEQMNQASHFLDGSVIYGSTQKKIESLRAMWGGRLITSLQDNGEEYPPPVNENDTLCHFMDTSDCYNAGDMRVNSQPQLRVLHTLFVREHNRVADRLALINDHWDDERVYQESRKIVIAEIQHITYSQWLPRILGKKYAMLIGLDPLQTGLGSLYDEDVEPTSSNSFATAALPFINSMIDGNIGLYMEDRNIADVNKLKEHFIKTKSPQINYLDNVIRGLATQNCQKIDNTFTDALTHYWYTLSGDFGMDLLSLDIQRGRDHGIPAYIHFRKYCNLSEVSSFNDLRGIVSQITINRLESVYKKVEDVDLLVGAISELPTKDAMVGPTLQCIIGEQFLRSKIGDRYFYENQKQPNSFSKGQLEQIRRSNLARIFCDNSNNVTRMQRDVFLIPDKKNELLNCRETKIPFINLSLWEEYELEEK